jgi:tripartite-type tricarboxylate transporter receptor subunit TctC
MRGGGLRRISAFAALVALFAASSSAQEPPSQKPVTLIVPFAAGGSTDVIARVIAEAMRASLGNPFIVDNRAGAGGSIGTAAIAKASPPTRICPTIFCAI